MSSLILHAGARFLMLVFSFVVLARGHNQPGGGFVGGLVAAAAVVLYGFACRPETARSLLRADASLYFAAGLLTAGASGLPGVLAGRPFLTGLWTEVQLPGAGALALGTPLVFDAGVYLVVLGATLTILLDLAED
jgi:multicomponent Na+:H+ antiporter subunit B